MTTPSAVSRVPARLVAIALAIAVAVAMLASPATAWADDALAREHFGKGVALYDRKQYALALESFRAAYTEKASPGIKQNIALSLKGLGRNVEAATAFDEALDEGADTLKPETRAAIERELAELSKLVATVRPRFIAAADRRPLDDVRVTVAPGSAPGAKVTLSPAASRRPIRLEPGIYVFTAHHEGLADPPEKRLSLLAGSPVDATFELGTPPAVPGTLTIKPSVPNATVQVDGGAAKEGTWTGPLAPGMHRVVVSAPGYQTTPLNPTIAAGTSVEYSVVLLPATELPPAYTAPVRRPPPPPKKRYLVPMLAYEGQSFRLGPILGERSGGTKRPFTGGSFGLRAGYRASPVFALELYGDVGRLSESYALTPAAAQSSTDVVHWQLAPLLRFATLGSVRFTAAMGFGVHGLIVDADIRTGSGATARSSTLKGSGVAASWLGDIGMQLDIGPLFLEAVAFFDMHGVGTTRENDSNQRMFLSSPGTRAGLRAGLGIPF